MSYEPLHEMVTTGAARLDRMDGCLIESGEWVASLYESYAADREWNEGVTYLTRPEQTPITTWREAGGLDYDLRDYGESLSSLGSYATVAQRLSEDLWTRDIHDVEV